jgi:hypothetical protein
MVRLIDSALNLADVSIWCRNAAAGFCDPLDS